MFVLLWLYCLGLGVASLQLTQFLILEAFEGEFLLLSLFFLCQFDVMIYHHIAVDRLADFKCRLVNDVDTAIE